MAYKRPNLTMMMALFSVLQLTTASLGAQAQKGFVKVFDGKTLNGWKLYGGHGPGYVVKDGEIVCPADGGGNLLLENEYTDFHFKFEFKLDKGANNGVGIRTIPNGDAAYLGIESQILDDPDPMYKDLKPFQYHGSLYGIIPSIKGSQKPTGEWNSEEIIAIGRKIKIIVNKKVIIDADINTVTDPGTIAGHPGMFRSKGYVGFLGHGPSAVAFRNISIKDLSKPEKENTAPVGFTALFNGKDLKGWKGLVQDPPKRAAMSLEKLTAEQAMADQQMRDHWKVENGALYYDGKGNSLCTEKDYADFEMIVDWKIGPKGDSGIYLRGSPQVQIWDNPLGSGGFYNNQKNPNNPIAVADKPVGEWNRFRIIMVGEKVHVFLNDVLVTRNTTMENYWERSKPIYPVGQLELQHHGDHLEFKNIYVREIKQK